jgi:hypothetical protein
MEIFQKAHFSMATSSSSLASAENKITKNVSKNEKIYIISFS